MSVSNSTRRKCHFKESHGHANPKTKTYNAWLNMRDRCTNEKSDRYYLYGRRGISVCERWQNSFSNFLSDMGVAPKDLTLERICTDGNYEPKNCCWATRKEQQNNRRTNVIITNNKTTMTLTQWAESSGLHVTTLKARLQNGWKFADALLIRPLKHGQYLRRLQRGNAVKDQRTFGNMLRAKRLGFRSLGQVGFVRISESASGGWELLVCPFDKSPRANQNASMEWWDDLDITFFLEMTLAKIFKGIPPKSQVSIHLDDDGNLVQGEAT